MGTVIVQNPEAKEPVTKKRCIKECIHHHFLGTSTGKRDMCRNPEVLSKRTEITNLRIDGTSHQLAWPICKGEFFDDGTEQDE